MFNSNVLDSFVSVVSRFPDNNAFLINGEYHTYNQFWNYISKIRTSLRGVEFDEKKVGIVVNDDIYTYASIFAVWMEGLAYVPLHPKQPIERNIEIVSQANLKYVLDSSLETEYHNDIVIKTIKCNSLSLTTDLITFSDDELAYILFTSGSTGKPKGVQITRGNLSAFMEAFFKIGFVVDENDKCLQCFDLTFDVSVQSFLVPLTHGACVYTVPHDQIKYSYVYGLLDDYELTFGVFAPSMIRYLRPYFDEIELPKLRYCILTAEASPIDLVNEWSQCIPNSKVYNFYGPTEATIYCTFYEVPKLNKIKEANGMLCIGKPFIGVNAVILDEHHNKVQQGIKGELYVSGTQLTIGYWANPERNEESFVNLNFNGENIRFYKTGDLCLEDEEGDLLYYGRLDYQVKIQGYRIELGEIEFHARECIGGKNALAFAYDGNGGNQEIAICLEIAEFDTDNILNILKSKLPSYMLPSKFLNLEEFPLNTSGKIDRNKIKSLLSL